MSQQYSPAAPALGECEQFLLLFLLLLLQAGWVQRFSQFIYKLNLTDGEAKAASICSSDSGPGGLVGYYLVPFPTAALAAAAAPAPAVPAPYTEL